ncbi:MAG: hypothetical protein SVR08_11050, partial [Spirochaetota bacterium]|nr:hypothetical protein [Spirochaetota bacterium]
LGIIGNTGHSFGKHLHFSLLKIDERKSINPFLILPKVKDSKKPKISNFYIKVGKKYYVINNNTKIRLTRHYPLLVSIIDSIKKNERLGIFKLKAIFNRKTVMDVMFSDIDFSKNGLTIDNNKYNDLLDVKGYYKVKDMTYKQGLNRLKIIAKDFYGNISTKEVSFNVKLEIAQD